MKRLMLKTLAAAVAISAFGAAFAQEKTIKFTTQNPKGHPVMRPWCRPSRAARSRWPR